MKADEEQRALWRDALGDDADRLWQAVPGESAPPLRMRFSSPGGERRWRFAAIAATVLAGLSLFWNWRISSELAGVRLNQALTLLQVDSSVVRLTALAALRDTRLSAQSVEVLIGIVTTARDPNVQLAALDLLLDSGALGSADDVAARVLEQVKNNRAFVAASLRARSMEI